MTYRIAIGFACALAALGAAPLSAQSASSASTTTEAGTRQSSASQTTTPGSATLNAPSPQQLTINPSSLQNPYYGSVAMGTVSPETLKLSLEDAIDRGLKANLGLTETRFQENSADAARLQTLQPLLPSLTAEASTGAHQFNLRTFGFGAGLLDKVAPLFPNLNLAGFNPIVKVDVTTADAALNWTAFDLSALTRYRAAKQDVTVAFYSKQSSRGQVVQDVGNQYLQTVADQSQIDSARALLAADAVLLRQVEAEHAAGTVPRLDESRARVQNQTQQQRLIAAENTFEKDQILLKREIGVPVEQKIELIDRSPYADLATMSLDEALKTAYQNRQDYQGIQHQMESARLMHAAARYERFPTLTTSGNYGITGLTHGMYHGSFLAMAELQLPLFKEAQIRGDADVAAAQENDIRFRIANLKQQINQQIRDSLLDLNSSRTLVEVSQQNVELAQSALNDANERFTSGVDDNLPVVQAQATLSQAQARLIMDTLNYNQAKLGLARNLGIIDTQYKAYLHGK